MRNFFLSDKSFQVKVISMGFNPENQMGNQVEWAVTLLWSINF